MEWRHEPVEPRFSRYRDVTLNPAPILRTSDLSGNTVVPSIFVAHSSPFNYEVNSIRNTLIQPSCGYRTSPTFQLRNSSFYQHPCSPPLHRAPRRRESEESKFDPRFGSTTPSERTLNPRRNESPRGGDDRFGFVQWRCCPGDCVERDQAGVRLEDG
ncbi:hypothetical protein K443DRAFT_612995 [Laccaria amethystina LaAM-08-1]|uniref:Uncharacterized protein n=1 Tax=Laccaria amethystina LaAM-08-1 TaxID=1095629 RepID=A0A0C9X5E1_9AGAR|nr:hypothetical protein K443DRAFT_612995 [Laccaria amethystina LaAM-08-1]